MLDCRSDHGGPEYERLVWGGYLILQLHSREVEHHHGPIGDADIAPGNGVLLWFEIDDFDSGVERATELDAEIIREPHRNPPVGQPGGPAHREIWLRDPDGYAIVLASPDGESPSD